MEIFDFTQTAVYQSQNRNEPADSLDDYPTCGWATRALLERLEANRGYSVR